MCCWNNVVCLGRKLLLNKISKKVTIIAVFFLPILEFPCIFDPGKRRPKEQARKFPADTKRPLNKLN